VKSDDADQLTKKLFYIIVAGVVAYGAAVMYFVLR
jgi:hypothetical protein